MGPTSSARCLACRRCLCATCHPRGPCERVDRGRRFFLMGALALPLAPKIVRDPVQMILRGYDAKVRIAVNGEVLPWFNMDSPEGPLFEAKIALLEERIVEIGAHGITSRIETPDGTWHLQRDTEGRLRNMTGTFFYRDRA